MCDFAYNKLSRVVVLSAHSYLYPTFTTGITVSGITGNESQAMYGFHGNKTL